MDDDRLANLLAKHIDGPGHLERISHNASERFTKAQSERAKAEAEEAAAKGEFAFTASLERPLTDFEIEVLRYASGKPSADEFRKRYFREHGEHYGDLDFVFRSRLVDMEFCREAYYTTRYGMQVLAQVNSQSSGQAARRHLHEADYAGLRTAPNGERWDFIIMDDPKEAADPDARGDIEAFRRMVPERLRSQKDAQIKDASDIVVNDPGKGKGWA